MSFGNGRTNYSTSLSPCAGPPGSGKSYLAKLIRDREAEYGGTVRIMSIDDYFMQEGEVEEKDPSTGKIVSQRFCIF